MFSEKKLENTDIKNINNKQTKPGISHHQHSIAFSSSFFFHAGICIVFTNLASYGLHIILYPAFF